MSNLAQTTWKWGVYRHCRGGLLFFHQWALQSLKLTTTSHLKLSIVIAPSADSILPSKESSPFNGGLSITSIIEYKTDNDVYRCPDFEQAAQKYGGAQPTFFNNWITGLWRLTPLLRINISVIEQLRQYRYKQTINNSTGSLKKIKMSYS